MKHPPTRSRVYSDVKKKTIKNDTVGSPFVKIYDDAGLINLLMCPSIEARPQLKKNATEEEREAAKNASVFATLEKRGMVSDSGNLSISDWGGVRYYIKNDVVNAYRFLTSHYAKRLVLAVLRKEHEICYTSRKKDSSAQSEPVILELVPKDIVTGRTPGSARKACCVVKKALSDCTYFSLLFRKDYHEEPLLYVCQKAGIWTVKKNAFRGPLRYITIPEDIYWDTDPHIVPIYILIDRQRVNKKIPVNKFLKLYNTDKWNTALAKTWVFSALKKLGAYTPLRLCHPRSAKEVCLEDFTAARCTNSYYVELSDP